MMLRIDTCRATLSGWPRGRPERAPLHVFVVLAVILSASNVYAADRYALIVSGAAGGDGYAQKYTAWRTAITTTLLEKLASFNNRARTARNGLLWTRSSRTSSSTPAA